MLFKDTMGTWHISTSGRDYAKSTEALPGILARFEPFIISSGNFRGNGNGMPESFEDLPARYQIDLDKATYLVYSFGTPIAWYVPAYGEFPNQWYIPVVEYSIPTARHQRMIRRALAPDRGFVIIS